MKKVNSSQVYLQKWEDRTVALCSNLLIILIVAKSLVFSLERPILNNKARLNQVVCCKERDGLITTPSDKVSIVLVFDKT